MRLSDYPRPRDDTGIGFHYFPDSFHYSQDDFARWMPILKSLGASWLSLLAPLDDALPEAFVKGLQDGGIEPLIRLYSSPIAPLDLAQLNLLARTYGAWGVHYIHVYNEPNLAAEWAHFDPEALPERFMALLLPCLEVLGNADGVVPVFTPLAPGGNVWDTEFLRICFELFSAWDASALFDTLAVGIHNHAGNRPLTWGRGGLQRWPTTKPYHTPPGSEDHMGFRLFEWYNAIIESEIGRSLPLIAYEHGARFGSRDLPQFPKLDETLHALRHAEMAFDVMNNHVPDYLFNNAFWLLSADPHSTFASDGWFRPDGRPRLSLSVEMLRQLPHTPRLLGPN